MYEVNQGIIDWLLEENNPPVKYLTQTKILVLNEQNSEVQETKSKINTYQPIQTILKNQKENTYWFEKGKDKNYKKYLGTFWQIFFLYELNSLKNNQIENAVEHLFSTGQAPNGGFSVFGTNSGVITCLTSNILRALLFFNYWEDERTKRALEYLLSTFVDNDGYIRCRTLSLIEGCYMTIPKILHVFGAIPVKDRTSRIQKGIDYCIKILLKNQIYKYVPDRNRDWMKIIQERKLKGSDLEDERRKFKNKYPAMKNIAKAGWTKFGFPLNYNSDVLDAMSSLVSINLEYTEELSSALELIKTKNVEGTWIKEKQYNSPMYTQIESYKKPSKWITLQALVVLKHFEGIRII
ncbi:MAG: hypothetical protein HGN29_02320 [Asgard group archaeon]|nr:hypothetical protein [Asgard group archaeon]